MNEVLLISKGLKRGLSKKHEKKSGISQAFYLENGPKWAANAAFALPLITAELSNAIDRRFHFGIVIHVTDVAGDSALAD
jgi:hypothetical protein